MKLSLEVSVGSAAGRLIPITVPQFVIGRDPDCQLRPASAVISKRHCALFIRDDKAFVQDFDSTNGTLVNDQPIKGEQELHDKDTLKIGPLAFVVRLEPSAPKARPTPRPQPAARTSEEEDVAAMLLAMQDEGGDGAAAASGGVPEGSTVFDVPAVPPPGEEGGKPAADTKPDKKKAPSMNTASAAEAILAKYSRRKRSH